MLYKFFDQNYAELFPEAVQFVLFALIWLNITDKIPNVNIARCKQQLSSAFVAEQSRQLFDLSLNAKTMYELLTRVSQNEQEYLTICKV